MNTHLDLSITTTIKDPDLRASLERLRHVDLDHAGLVHHRHLFDRDVR